MTFRFFPSYKELGELSWFYLPSFYAYNLGLSTLFGKFLEIWDWFLWSLERKQSSVGLWKQSIQNRVSKTSSFSREKDICYPKTSGNPRRTPDHIWRLATPLWSSLVWEISIWPANHPQCFLANPNFQPRTSDLDQHVKHNTTLVNSGQQLVNSVVMCLCCFC